MADSVYFFVIKISDRAFWLCRFQWETGIELSIT